MIDIVAILFSPNATPSGLAVSGTTSIKVNEESFGSYIMSSVIFTLNTVSCPKEELNKIFDEGRSNSAAVYKRLQTCINTMVALTYLWHLLMKKLHGHKNQ